MVKGTMRNLLQRGWETFIDPDRRSRVTELAEYLRRRIAKEKKAFSLATATAGRDFDPEDVRLARLSVYRTYTDRVLHDDTVSDSERASLDWVSSALQLTAAARSEIHHESGREAFGRVFATAIDDGHIDEAESEQIRALAAFMGESVADVVSEYFSQEGEHFLSSVFLSSIEDGQLLKQEWSRFLESAQRLGLSRNRALVLIRRHALGFVEHVLADAKSDGRITKQEESHLDWLMTELAISKRFREYAKSEIRELRLLEEIEAGHLPTVIDPIPVELRAGEIVHFYGPARFHRVRELKSGTRVDTYDGNLAITDSRLVFASQQRPFTLNLRKVISLGRDGNLLQITANSQATGCIPSAEVGHRGA